MSTVAAPTRTSELARAIQEFKNSEVHDPSMRDGRGQGRRPVEDFRAAAVADENCSVVATQFTDFLRERGLRAHTGLPGHDLCGEMHPDAWGYRDRPVSGWGSHAATTCEISGETYMVDWTAAQYGYSEFPMIQVMSFDGNPPSWMRLRDLPG